MSKAPPSQAHKSNEDAKDAQSADVELSLEDIAKFVKDSNYGKHLRLMSSVDTTPGHAPNSAEDQSKPKQARFFAEAHTYALAV